MNYNKAMKNIIDYIKEYGNLTLEEYPFNNVDSLILSQISYIKFENSSIDIESEVHLLTEFENEIDTLCIDTRVPELNEELFFNAYTPFAMKPLPFLIYKRILTKIMKNNSVP